MFGAILTPKSFSQYEDNNKPLEKIMLDALIFLGLFVLFAFMSRFNLKSELGEVSKKSHYSNLIFLNFGDFSHYYLSFIFFPFEKILNNRDFEIIFY